MVFSNLYLTDSQKLDFIKLLLLIGSMMTGFNFSYNPKLLNQMNICFMLFIISSILYYLIIQTPAKNKLTKNNKEFTCMLIISSIVSASFLAIVTSSSLNSLINSYPEFTFFNKVVIFIYYFVFWSIITLALGRSYKIK